jgi:uncharacterized protein (TIGR00369 family)
MLRRFSSRMRVKRRVESAEPDPASKLREKLTGASLGWPRRYPGDAMEGFATELGLREETAADGTARIVFDALDAHLNPAGTVHGGVLATLVDTAMASAVRSATDDGEVPATTQLTLAFLHAARPGRLSARAEISKQGDHLMLCEADVEQDGRTLVHAVGTFAVLQR